MKHFLQSGYRQLICLIAIMLTCSAANASHVVGIDLSYKWISGDNYKITLMVYGDCGPSSSSAFSTLRNAAPDICVYDAGRYITTLTLHIDTPGNPRNGKEITPVCPSDTSHTQCTNPSYTIPGIKRFVYVGNYTVPHTSHFWRFQFNSYMGSASGTGRAAAITNISGAGSTLISLVDTLDNVRGNNSSPVLTIVPTPFFCLNNSDHYSPGAVDADGDSLAFDLVTAGNPASASCGPGGAVTYLTGYSAIAPLHTYTGAYYFDHLTGQVSFTPDINQRSLVVYNIREYRNDTLIGTSQREMTFLVLTCTTPPPSGTLTGATAGTIDDSTHYHICANTVSSFDLTLSPTESDTNLHITVTTTGLPLAFALTITNNGTNHPDVHITGTTFTTPGIYTFYITFTDDNCPLNGSQTLAYTISILPIPTVSYSVIRPSTCAGDAILSISPGGLGSPWTVDLLDATGTLIRTHAGLYGTYIDTITAGNDSLVIYSALSRLCNTRIPLTITTNTFPDPSISSSNPTFCGNNDGVIHLSGIDASQVDTITYNVNGTAATPISVLSSPTGTIDINNLCAGVYTNIVINFGRCHSTPVRATLTNPSFSIASLTYTDPTTCGVPDGSIKIHGIRPGQADSIFYDFNGVPQSAFVAVAAPDSTLTIPALLAGTYANVIAKTVGACPGTPYNCVSNRLGPVTLQDPVIHSACTFETHLGCDGDTVFFHNSSTPAGLYSRWYFGDGYTDTNASPYHIYMHIPTATYTAKLFMTNTHCLDSTINNITFPERVGASFKANPDTICQGSPITFANTSAGVGNQYSWSFGDGGTDTAKSPQHAFANTGLYTVTLTATDAIPCTSTVSHTVQIDSSSAISMQVSDTVICKGGLVTFTGLFTQIGLIGTEWSFSDGVSMLDINPIQRSFENTGTITARLIAKYRTCPQVNADRYLRVWPNPAINLGPDTSVCAGGGAITLSDDINYNNNLASWEWNTGETTAAITVKKAGYYSAKVMIYGCLATDSVLVANDCYLDIPNVFTPNGDGINDYFFPRDILTHGITSFAMSIYNRWGQLVYKTGEAEGRGWDGKFNDIPQPEGVYIYQIDARFKDGQKLNRAGNITIVR